MGNAHHAGTPCVSSRAGNNTVKAVPCPGALTTCTAALQLLCLHHANHLGLDVEQPRAGREGGAAYLAAQSAYFTR